MHSNSNTFPIRFYEHFASAISWTMTENLNRKIVFLPCSVCLFTSCDENLLIFNVKIGEEIYNSKKLIGICMCMLCMKFLPSNKNDEFLKPPDGAVPIRNYKSESEKLEYYKVPMRKRKGHLHQNAPKHPFHFKILQCCCMYSDKLNWVLWLTKVLPNNKHYLSFLSIFIYKLFFNLMKHYHWLMV